MGECENCKKLIEALDKRDLAHHRTSELLWRLIEAIKRDCKVDN